MIYISITTTPPRLPKLKTFIDNISKNNKIILNIPISYKRFDQTIDIPNYDVIINRCIDYGPATKIIPTLELDFINDNDIIIYCDDDQIYHHIWMKIMIDNIKENQESINFYSGFTYWVDKNEKIFIKRKIDNKVPIIEGFAGVGFYKKIITQKFINDIKTIMDQPNEMFYSDDVWISFIINKNDIAKKKINVKDYGLEIKDPCHIKSLTLNLSYGEDKLSLKNCKLTGTNNKNLIKLYKHNKNIRNFIDNYNIDLPLLDRLKFIKKSI
jgi:hypothetical protein